MKHVKQILPILCLLAGLYACHKDLSGSVDPDSIKTAETAHPLTLSDTTAKLGQPIVATMPTGLTANSATWSVRPSAGVQVSSASQSATITFSTPGKYTIVAHYILDSVAGTQDSCTAPITISDSNYTPPPIDSITLVGEKFVLQPYSVDTGITFLIETADSYPCGYLMTITQGALPWSNFITLAGYIYKPSIYSTCANPSAPVEGYFTVDQVAVGSVDTVSILLPGPAGTYRFTVAAADSTYTFTPLANGAAGFVTLSPTTIHN